MENPTIVDIRFRDIMEQYKKLFPPYGIPEKNTLIYDHREAMVLGYNIYLLSPNEYEYIMLNLFDEFDAAIALVILQSGIRN
jgi:hypothetical protein